MITCPKCSKDNQDHYKFCLGCGAELPRGPAPKPFSPQTPPQGMKRGRTQRQQPPQARGRARRHGSQRRKPRWASEALWPSLRRHPSRRHGRWGRRQRSPRPRHRSHPRLRPSPPWSPPSRRRSTGPRFALASSCIGPTPAPPGHISPVAASSAATVVCPQCGHINAPSNLFCGSCGFRLGSGVPRAAAPAPAAPSLAESPAGSMILTALRADGSEAGTYQLDDRKRDGGPRDRRHLRRRQLPLAAASRASGAPGPGRSSVKDEGSPERRLQAPRSGRPDRAQDHRHLPNWPGNHPVRGDHQPGPHARRRRAARRAEQGVHRSDRPGHRARRDRERLSGPRERRSSRPGARRHLVPGRRVRLGPALPPLLGRPKALFDRPGQLERNVPARP